MNMVEIVNHFVQTQIPIQELKIFSKLPGIYAFFFIGKNFPLENFEIPQNKIIYIGKTESSQQSRDANTHFKTGKTGSSTVRKSVGALLSQSEEIIPIIRSWTDIEKGRTSHYKFNQNSEERVTKWMVENLAVSFYEYPASKAKINQLETDLIKILKPVLNIDAKNAGNPHLVQIKALRKALGAIVHSTPDQKTPITMKETRVSIAPKIINMNTSSFGKYVPIWTAYLEEMKRALAESSEVISINLDKNLFEQAGNRKNFAFRLDYTEGKVSNNIGGSAVARDLNKVLTSSKIQVGNKTFKMNKEFKLTIE
ncbi:hypothetical protein L0B70_12135 [Kaistella sp. 97-N-M2]|uniref:GIY-YIG nuclease family protein n=1 Tax=Kaistella sp. 97-N-M2 TaxID=2908645 RepID=UPI001F29F678|nr:hypothetical protein [Kaistella sp. 97-N-M2]UJF29571.1 hypothetical protein L0B70_12135 [Kaistella sp. 97-N-M2]